MLEVLEALEKLEEVLQFPEVVGGSKGGFLRTGGNKKILNQ